MVVLYRSLMIKMLEVGPGSNNALWAPGTIFAEETVEYIGLDSRAMPKKTTTLSRPETTLPGIHAALHEADLPDDSFDIILMKSVLGDYTLPLLKRTDTSIDPVGIYSESTTFNQTFIEGLAAVFRALRSSGLLVISEEDTPLPASKLLQRLAGIGFTDIELTPYLKRSFLPTPSRGPYAPRTGSMDKFIDPDEAWFNLRNKYWETRTEDILGKKWIVNAVAHRYPTTAYIATATKPDH